VALAAVTSTSTDHVLAWVFVGYDVPFAAKGGGTQGRATVLVPVGIVERHPLFAVLAQSS
jgi:hypothetical protein